MIRISNPIQWIKGLRPAQVFSYSLFFLSGCIMVATILLMQTVDVVKDWKLIVPKKTYTTGETVVIQSQYVKLKDVTGKSTRYIECENRDNIWIRYPLNEAVANRGSGAGGTGIVVKIPDQLADLPTQCKFTISISYQVYPWKDHLEVNSSNEFTVERGEPCVEVCELSPDQVSQAGETSQTPASQVPGSSLTVGRSSQQLSSSSNDTPVSSTPQSNTSQQTFQGAEGQPTQGTRPLEPTPEPTPEPPSNLLPLIDECVLGVNILGGCL